MKKKILSTLAIGAMALASFAISAGENSANNADRTAVPSVHRIFAEPATSAQMPELACSKCKITNYEHTCGKCGGHMNSKFTGRWKDKAKNHPIYRYTCKRCGHYVDVAL